MFRALLLLMLLGVACQSATAAGPTPTSPPRLSSGEAVGIVQTWLSQRSYASSGRVQDCLAFHQSLNQPEFGAVYLPASKVWKIGPEDDSYIWHVFESGVVLAVEKFDRLARC